MNERSQRGAAAVEFAVVLPLLLVLLFGIVEFSILLFDKALLTNASREGARAGIVMRVPRVLDVDIQNIIKDYAEEHMVGFGPSSSLDFGPWSGEDPWILPVEASRTGHLFGEELIVTVKYPFNFPVLSSFGLGPITLEAQTRMRME